MRLIDADKLYPDCMTKNGTLAISQSQIANAPTVSDAMEEDAKQASIPYTYNAPQHDWKCGYPDITKGNYYNWRGKDE